MPSIRGFLVSVTLSVICLVNFVAALHGYDRSIDRAERLIEAQLAETAGMLMQLIEQQDDIPPALLGDQRYFQLWRGEQLLRQSANAPGILHQCLEDHELAPRQNNILPIDCYLMG